MSASTSARFAVVSFLVAAALVAQCPPAAWSPLDPASGLTGQVNAIAEYDQDGPGPQPPVLVVGGQVLGVQSTIISWTGSAWQPLGFGTDGLSVSALRVFNGDLIVAGSFNFAGSGYVGHIARWN